MFYNNNRYIPEWRLRLVHLAAKVAGLTVHVHGMPYGSRSKKYEFESEPSPLTQAQQEYVEMLERANSEPFKQLVEKEIACQQRTQGMIAGAWLNKQ